MQVGDNFTICLWLQKDSFMTVTGEGKIEKVKHTPN